VHAIGKQRVIGFCIGSVALVLGLLAGPLAPRDASAGLSGCRSDPAVVLSNGATLDLSADVADIASDVSRVDYVVHAPAGTHAVAVVNTDGLIGMKEKFTFYADSAWSSYRIVTTVYTGTSAVSVRANSLLVSVLGLTLGAASTSGFSGQPLSMQFNSLL
jgi:hypothetical protein